MELNSKSSKIQSFYDDLFGFDTETTGLDKFPDTRPTGVAFLKYNSDFKNYLNLDISIRLPFGHFPSPGSMIVQDKFYSQINSKNNLEFYDAMAKVKNFISSKLRGKIICGHNINGFDTKQLNVWFNKALYDPYPFQKKFGNYLIDTIPVARFAKAIGGDHFKFQNFRLETLMKFFLGESYTQLHGAPEDVKDVFRLIEFTDKKLRLLKGKNLVEILQWYSSEINRKNVFSNSLILKPSNKGVFESVIPLSDCKSWKGYKIIIPFHKDKIDWSGNDAEAVANQIKSISSPSSISSKKEFVYPVDMQDKMSDIGENFLNKLPITVQYLRSVVKLLRGDREFINQCQISVDESRRKSKKPVSDYEGHYRDGDGFFDKDSDRMKFFHQAIPEKKREIIQSFENKGIRKNAKLFLFNKHPEVLSQAEWDCMFEEIRDEFLDDKNTSRVTYASCYEEFDQIKQDVKNGKRVLSDRQRDILDDYKVRLEAFKANPKRFWEQRHGY